jgi:hypothetical protein
MIGSRSWPDRTDHVWRQVLEENKFMWGPLLRRAQEHGYVTGESVLGGAYVLSRACVAALDKHGYLDLVPSGAYLPEDVIFSVLTQAAGFELHEFAGPDQPFALAWRGLPMPPAQILANGKKVVHREHRPARARRILGRCARILPGQPVIWVGLAVSLLPGFLSRPLNTLRILTISACGHFLRRSR